MVRRALVGYRDAMPETPALRRFAYDDVVVRVQAAGDTLDWLAEATAPWFEEAPAAAGDAADVVFREDAAAVARIVGTARPTGRNVACFTMDRTDEPWSVLRDGDGDGDGGEIAWEPSLGAILRARGDALEVVVEVERTRGRLVLLRARRERASARLAARGALAVHASAVAVAGRVTLFVGGKRAGKTTLLLHALRDPGARWVANDRVSVRDGTARGMPTVVMLREGSLAHVPGLREALATGAWHHASTVAEARAHTAAGTQAPGAARRWPPGVGAAHLGAIAGWTAVAGGPVDRIVFPRIDLAEKRFTLRRLDPDDACARLLADGLLAGKRTDGFLPGARVGAAAPETIARPMVRRAACFACAMGPDAYLPPSVWDALRG
jgi:hypothetical protein